MNILVLLMIFSTACKAINPEERLPEISLDALQDKFNVDRIVGGWVENPAHSHPWQVLVLIDGSICGGTILNANFVLTAAHCIPATGITSSYIVAGASTWCSGSSTGLYWNSEVSQQITSIKSVYRTTGKIAYNSTSLNFDIAILEVNTAFRMTPQVQPAALPTTVTAVGTNLIVSGWGTTSEDGSISCSLREVIIPKVAKDTCNVYYGNSIRSSQLCAGLAAGGKDSCQGDSGGPLVIKNATSGVATVVGVVSFGIGCGQPNYYGVYTDVFQFLPWIRSIIGRTTPATCTSTTNVRAIGDGYCNPELNTAGCLWDAGDCCDKTRIDWNKFCGTNCVCNRK